MEKIVKKSEEKIVSNPTGKLVEKIKKLPVKPVEPTDDEYAKAIVGEVGPYGKEGMQWVASTIRNRKQGLKGVYGGKNPNVVAGKYTKQQYKDAMDSVIESRTKSHTDAHHWFSDADLKQQKVQDIIRKDKLKFIKNVGKNNFYKKP